MFSLFLEDLLFLRTNLDFLCVLCAPQKHSVRISGVKSLAYGKQCAWVNDSCSLEKH